MRKGKK